MNQYASAMIEFLVLLIVIVITSSVVLLLVQTGVLTVKAAGEEVSVLNTEFLPYSREAILTVKEVQFCERVEQFRCIQEKKTFHLGEKVEVLFLAESSTVDGEIYLRRNYRLTDPQGTVVLEMEEAYPVQQRSSKQTELVAFTDSISTSPEAVPGEYTLEVIVENPLLQKKVIRHEKVRLE